VAVRFSALGTRRARRPPRPGLPGRHRRRAARSARGCGREGLRSDRGHIQIPARR